MTAKQLKATRTQGGDLNISGAPSELVSALTWSADRGFDAGRALYDGEGNPIATYAEAAERFRDWTTDARAEASAGALVLHHIHACSEAAWRAALADGKVHPANAIAAALASLERKFIARAPMVGEKQPEKIGDCGKAGKRFTIYKSEYIKAAKALIFPGDEGFEVTIARKNAKGELKEKTYQPLTYDGMKKCIAAVRDGAKLACEAQAETLKLEVIELPKPREQKVDPDDAPQLPKPDDKAVQDWESVVYTMFTRTVDELGPVSAAKRKELLGNIQNAVDTAITAARRSNAAKKATKKAAAK